MNDFKQALAINAIDEYSCKSKYIFFSCAESLLTFHWNPFFFSWLSTCSKWMVLHRELHRKFSSTKKSSTWLRHSSIRTQTRKIESIAAIKKEMVTIHHKTTFNPKPAQFSRLFSIFIELWKQRAKARI